MPHANNSFTNRARLAGKISRSARRVASKLGIIPGEQADRVKKVRCGKLDRYDSYYESIQYDHLSDWDESVSCDDYVAIRKRKPRIIYNFAKILAHRVTSKLVGDNVFPSFKVKDDPDTEEYLRFVLKASKLQHRILDPVKHMCVSGSSLVRFYVEAGVIKVEHYNAKHVYPEFQPNGELLKARIQYVYADVNDLDEKGKPREKWYKLELGMFVDTLYDNPEYQPNVDPIFSVEESVPHNLGFVQAEWLRTAETLHSPDGPSLIMDILDFIDELNYSLSQSSQSVGYNQDPQLTINKMDEEEVGALIRSSTKAWNMGREGKAEFIESGMNGVQAAMDFRDKIRLNVQDVARIVLLDPEKMVDHAQSGKAMEVLHGPLVELVNELRPMMEDRLTKLLQKMAITLLILNQQGLPVPVVIPPGYRPKSLSLSTMWPPIFPQTMQDLQLKVNIASSVSGANLVSRETMTGWLASDFDIEDMEEEQRRIEAQPVINPFGAF